MQKSFKIVFLRLNPNATGGAERYLSRLISALDKAGSFSSVRSYKGAKWLASWVKALIFNAQASRQKQSDELYFSLERISSADIYRAGDGVHKIYRLQKRAWWLNPLNFIYPFLEKRCFKNAIKIIANSEFVAKQITLAYNIKREKIKIIYNGINLPISINKPFAKIELSKRLGLDVNLPLLIFVGSGFKRKGVSELLEISQALKNNSIKHNLIIIGKDKRLKSYQKLAQSLGVEAKFMGELSGVGEYYCAADAFVFPTRYEPFSNVVLEALSYGCASFTTAQNGASEILPPEWVLSGNSQTDAVLIANALKEKNELKARAIAENFTIEKNAALTLEVINEVLTLKQNMLK